MWRVYLRGSSSPAYQVCIVDLSWSFSSSFAICPWVSFLSCTPPVFRPDRHAQRQHITGFIRSILWVDDSIQTGNILMTSYGQSLSVEVAPRDILITCQTMRECSAWWPLIDCILHRVPSVWQLCPLWRPFLQATNDPFVWTQSIPEITGFKMAPTTRAFIIELKNPGSRHHSALGPRPPSHQAQLNHTEYLTGARRWSARPHCLGRI
jgi:hypothetical protein